MKPKAVFACLLALAISCAGSPDPSPILDVGGDALPEADVEDSDAAGPEGDLTDEDVHVPPLLEPPVDAPVSPTLAQGLGDLLREYLAFSGDPGVSYAVWTGDDEWWSGAAGVRDIQSGIPLEPEMGFRVGSNSKTFMSAILLLLMEDGLIDLDMPISDYLPQYPQWGVLSTRHLLAMQSGLPDYLTTPEFLLSAMIDPDALLDPGFLISFMEDEEVNFQPGEGCEYCNTNYVLAGMLIEAVTGQSAQDVLRERIIEPLGLVNTYLDVDGGVRDDLAHGYLDVELTYQVFGVPAEALSFIPDEWLVDGNILDATYVFPPAIAWTAGSVTSCARDMVVFMRALVDGILHEPASIEEMKETTFCALFRHNGDYGLGLHWYDSPWGQSFGHGGLHFGYSVSTQHIPDAGLTWSVMHDWLPSSADFIPREALGMIMDGYDGTWVPFLPPEDFFDASDGDRLEIRWRGAVTPAGQAGHGTYRFAAHLGGETILYTGFGAKCGLDKSGVTAQVVIEAAVPEPADPNLLRSLRFSMPQLTLKDGGGYWSLNLLQPYAVVGVLMDVVLYSESGKLEQFCVTAVPDFERTTEVIWETPEGWKPVVGSQLKLYGSVALATSTEAIEEYLAPLQFPRCFCFNEAGEPVLCEE